jgi:tetrahydromethanopterin S-methyltransferase subunit C
LSRVATESRTLVVQELHLATSELTSKAKSAGVGVGLLGAAGILGLFALATLSVAAILALALVVPAWLAALLIAIFYGVVGAVLALKGKTSLQHATPLVPEQTMKTLGSLTEKLQRAWQRGQR